MRTFIAVVAISMLTAGSLLAADGPRVVVQPFTEANERQSPDWITKTLQQSLSDELAASKSVQLLTGTAAKPADAQFVITGQIQRLDGELRVTGQVIDTGTNKAVGGYKATGSDRELFGIEDSIASQVKSVIVPPSAQPPVAAVAAVPTTLPTHIETPFAPSKFGPFEGSDLQASLRNRSSLQVPTRVVETYVVQAPQQNYNVGLNGGYGYGYNPYGYGYGYNGWGWGGGVVIIGGGGGHGHGGYCPPGSNGQAMRATTFQGNAPVGVINTMRPGAVGSINTISPGGGGGMHVGGR